MPGPIIWGPNNTALNLENGIQFGSPANSPAILSGAVNPTSSAVSAGKGSIYLSTLTGVAYVKTDNGSSTNWTALGAGGSSYPQDPTTNMLYLADEFDGGSREASTAHVMGRFSWATQAQNAGTFSTVGSVITSSVNHPGVLEIGSGVNANDACTIYQGRQGGAEISKVFVLGSGAIRARYLINIPTLSDGTDNFTVVCGFADNPDWASPANAVRIMYQYATDTTHWLMSTIKASTETKTAGSGSTSTVLTGWTWLQIDINAAGTSVTFSVGPTLAGLVSIGTQATNVPVLGMPFRTDFRKTLGTTSRKIGIDFVDGIMALSR